MYFPSLEQAQLAADDENSIEKWDDYYPPEVVERLCKEDPNIFSDRYLQELLASDGTTGQP